MCVKEYLDRLPGENRVIDEQPIVGSDPDRSPGSADRCAIQPGRQAKLDLAVVMPVYNEQDCIGEVVQSWLGVLSRLNIRFKLIVLNDGSVDRTAEVLASLSGDELTKVNKPNSGHGPTILQGYRQAVESADWVFQCDSDDEMKAEHFAPLWEIRDDYDAVFGCRQGRRQNLGRRFISFCSRMTVHILFGAGIVDVNTPYRLMRAELLRQVVEQIPDATFAPNVIISGAFARSKLRLKNIPVPHEGRRTGAVSIVKWKLWKAAIRAFWQTLRCRPRIRVPGSG
jgi:glycosyltransferase involved in cell wall biosynthesis